MNFFIKLLATFIFTALFIPLVAQDKFNPGFYVTNERDTVKGFIRYESSYTKGLMFRQQVKGSGKYLPIDQVKSFGLNSGEVYSREQFENLQTVPSYPVFVRSVVDGEVDFFKYRGRYFIGSPSKGHYKLAQEKTSNASQALKNYQVNTGIFNILFQDCPEVKEQAQKVSIAEEKLAQLLRSYHTCHASPHREFLTKNTKRINYLGVFVGVSFSSLSFAKPASFSEASYLYKSNFPVSTQPTFGIMGLLGGKRSSSLISFQGELVYSRAKFKATYSYVSTEVVNYDIHQTSITSIDYNQLGLKAGLRITGRSNILNPYLSFGVATQTFISFNSSVNQITKINDSVEEENFEVPISKSSFALWTGVGVKRKLSVNHSIFLEANYNNTFLSNDGNVSALAVRLGYFF